MLRVRLKTEKGELTDVVFQYEAFIEDKWHPIVRIEKDFPNVEEKQPEKESNTKKKYVRVRNSFEFSK